MQELRNLLTVSDVMRITHLGKRKIQNEVSGGSLAHVKLGRSVRFLPEDVVTYISARRIEKRKV